VGGSPLLSAVGPGLRRNPGGGRGETPVSTACFPGVWGRAVAQIFCSDWCWTEPGCFAGASLHVDSDPPEPRDPGVCCCEARQAALRYTTLKPPLSKPAGFCAKSTRAAVLFLGGQKPPTCRECFFLVLPWEKGVLLEWPDHGGWGNWPLPPPFGCLLTKAPRPRSTTQTTRRSGPGVDTPTRHGPPNGLVPRAGLPAAARRKAGVRPP